MEIDYSKIPQNYVYCMSAHCPEAGTCLRHLATQAVPAATKQFTVVNPEAYLGTDGRRLCYQTSEPQHIALGMRNMLRQVKAGDAALLRAQFIACFGRNKYYRMRNGEHAITPDMQQQVADLFAHHAPYVSVTFDEYCDEVLF